MKIPSQVKIGGHTVGVEFSKTLGGGKYLGMAELSLKKIRLATSFDGKFLPESQKAQTFLHEILHHASSVCGADLSERNVRCLSESLFQVIRDNDLDFRKPK
jgi:hypothetical protein